jgi:hypothetical protein
MQRLKSKVFAATCLMLLCWLPRVSHAQDITGIISAGITKVIKAVDLEVQRIQNKTVWLQEAQKTLENAMQQLHLNEITDWVQKQKDLYAEYFQELWKVKAIISYYYRIKDIIAKEAALLNAYKQAWGLLQQDKHFTPSELQHMQAVYAGILQESAKSVDELTMVINSFTTEMSDADRLDIINHAGNEIDRHYTHLLLFNNENEMLSLQRAHDQEDVDLIRKMYGLE